MAAKEKIEPCEPCVALNKQLSKTEPHAALKKTDERQWKASGMAVGVSEFYTCKTCGQKWDRDCDRKDDKARWDMKN